MDPIPYPTDWTDNEWHLIAPLLPESGTPGRPRQHSWRDLLKASCSVLRTGCQWRYLPEGFPNHNTVYWYFARWQDDGTWERVSDALRRRVRTRLGREPEPSAAILDSQSVKTTERGAIAATMRASR